MSAVARPPPRSAHSHSHTQTRQKTTPSGAASPSTRPSRPPSSAAPSMAFVNSRTPGGKEQPRPSSPNYFGLTVNPASNPRDSSVRPKDNWSPPTSSIRSFNAQTPKHISVEANPDFEAFRRQTEANQSFSLSHGNLSYFASTPGIAARNSSISQSGDGSSNSFFSPSTGAGGAASLHPKLAGKDVTSFFDVPRQTESPMTLPNIPSTPLGRREMLADRKSVV